MNRKAGATGRGAEEQREGGIRDQERAEME